MPMNPGEKALSGPADVGEPSVELPQIPRIVFHSRILPIVPTGVKHIPSFRNFHFSTDFHFGSFISGSSLDWNMLGLGSAYHKPPSLGPPKCSFCSGSLL